MTLRNLEFWFCLRLTYFEQLWKWHYKQKKNNCGVLLLPRTVDYDSWLKKDLQELPKEDRNHDCHETRHWVQWMSFWLAQIPVTIVEEWGQFGWVRGQIGETPQVVQHLVRVRTAIHLRSVPVFGRIVGIEFLFCCRKSIRCIAGEFNVIVKYTVHFPEQHVNSFVYSLTQESCHFVEKYQWKFWRIILILLENNQ